MCEGARRFAPSPTGHLHLGHAYSAIMNMRAAAWAGAPFLLRIEDIDHTRCQPNYTTAIFEDLGWLGLAWEGDVRIQSRHRADYARRLDELRAADLVYPSRVSRAELNSAFRTARANGQFWSSDPGGTPCFPQRGSARAKALEAQSAQQPDAGHNLRLDCAEALRRIGKSLFWSELALAPDGTCGPAEKIAAKPEQWGDIIVARRDIGTSYHLSVVIDDALQQVSHVIRGRDIFAATSIHRLLQELLGLPCPAYSHHPLIADTTARKLSKSANAQSLRDLRIGGMVPPQIYKFLQLAQP